MTTPEIAKGLASLGRNGDSMLMHVTPHEVAGLQAIAKANGTSLTINPQTGLPEAFSMGGFFKSILPTIAGFGAAGMTGGAMSPMLAGILAGSATGALTNKKDPLMGAVMGGIGGYGGAGLQGSAAAFNSAGSAGTATATQSPALEQVVNQAGGTMSDAMMSPQIGQQLQSQALSNAPWNPAAYQGATGELGANMAATNLPVSAQPAGQMTSALTQQTAAPVNGLQKAFSNVASDPMGFINQNKMALAMPVGMAALSGIEAPQPGMSQEEYEAEQQRKFNRPLNLNEDTGLRLASGGVIAFDDGGSVPSSNLNLKREEDQMAPMQMQAPQQPVQSPQVAQPAQTELGIAALKPGQENEVKINISGAQMAPLAEGQQVTPLADRVQTEGIPALMQGLNGEGLDYEKLYGRTQAPAPMGPVGGARGFGPDGRRLAAGGAIQSGGVMDLYQGADSQPTFGGNQGFGLGRLSNLAGQQSMARAEQGNFAKGGVPRLEDGGFVVPADVTFYLGNHNTEAGQKKLAQMYGAVPIKGPGTGLSDSIPTSIEGKEPAKIANGEAYIPSRMVEAHGGPQKFYKMMDKIRKKATGSTKQAKSA